MGRQDAAPPVSNNPIRNRKGNPMDNRRLFTVACAICIAALGGGCFLVVFLGGLPDWLLQAELAAFCSVALVYGFFASLPTLTPWLWSRPIRGAALVCLGVALSSFPWSLCSPPCSSASAPD